MDANRVVEALRYSTSPDMTQQKEAEALLDQMHKIAGFVPLLLQIAMSDLVEMPVRQAAIVYMKNMVKRYWEDREANETGVVPFAMHEDDRKQIREAYLEALARAPQLIRVQLCTALSEIVRSDFPNRWFNALDGVVAYLNAGVENAVAVRFGDASQLEAAAKWNAALTVLNCVLDSYSYKDKERDRVTMIEPLRDVLIPLLIGRGSAILDALQQLAAMLQADTQLPQNGTGWLSDERFRAEVAPLYMTLKLVLKCLQTLIRYSMPIDAVSTQHFLAIVGVAKRTLETPLLTNLAVFDYADRSKHVEWNARKWAAKVACSAQDRYGQPKKCVKQYVAYAEAFSKHCGSAFVSLFVVLLRRFAQFLANCRSDSDSSENRDAADQQRQALADAHFVSDEVAYRALNYTAEAFETAVGYRQLRQHTNWLIEAVIFRLLITTGDDDQLWQDDAAEYVRTRFDRFEDPFTPIGAAKSLFESAARRRKDMLAKALAFIMNVLQQTSVAALAATHTPQHLLVAARQRDAALHLLGTVSTVLKKRKQYADQLPNLLVAYVFPEFTSPFGFLRARACWMLEQFAGVNFTSAANKQNEPILDRALELVADCLAPCTSAVTAAEPLRNELPVRCEAGRALIALIMEQDHVKEKVRTRVGDVLLHLLDIHRESADEQLASGLSTVISEYAEQVKPIANDVCMRLSATFMQLLDEHTSEDHAAHAAQKQGVLAALNRGSARTSGIVIDGCDDDDARTAREYAAISTLETLECVLETIEDHKAVLSGVEAHVATLCDAIFRRGAMAFYENALNLTYSLTYSAPISETAYALLYSFTDAFKRDAFDYFTEAMPTLYNLATVDRARFTETSRPLETIFELVRAVVSTDGTEEDMQANALKLLEVIILEYRDALRANLQPILELVVGRMWGSPNAAGMWDNLRIMCLTLLLTCVYANAPFTVAYLDQPLPPAAAAAAAAAVAAAAQKAAEGDQQAAVVSMQQAANETILSRFIRQCFLIDTDCFTGVHDRKVWLLGLCALLTVPPENRPPVLAAVANQLLPKAIVVFEGLKRAYENKAKEDEEDENYREDEDGDEEDDDDEEEDEETEDSAKRGSKQRNSNSNDIDVDDDDDDDDDDEDDDDDDDDLYEDDDLESYETALDKEECEIDEYVEFRRTLEGLSRSDVSFYSALTSQLVPESFGKLEEVFRLAEQRYKAAEAKRIEKAGGFQFASTLVPNSFNFGSPPSAGAGPQPNFGSPKM